MKTMYTVTAQELSPGVPDWGAQQNVTQLPTGQTSIAIENLRAGQRYYVKVWNEDDFGNQSSPIIRVVDTPRPTKTVPFSFSANGYLDSGSPMRAYVKVPLDVQEVSSCVVSLAFRQFMAPATANTADSGSLTSDSGGGSTSGASSASSSGSDGHVHYVALWNSDTAGVFTKRKFTSGDGGALLNIETAVGSGVKMLTSLESTTSGIINSSHSHTIAHTHTTPSHQHTVPTHTHGLTYGTYEEAYPTSHSVTLAVYKRVGSSWTLIYTSGSLTGDLEDVDLTDYITGPGDWRIEVQSAAAQPNGGRLGLDIYGALEVTI